MDQSNAHQIHSPSLVPDSVSLTIAKSHVCEFSVLRKDGTPITLPMAALAGHRQQARWPWRITWVLVATPAAIAATGLAMAEPEVFVFAMVLLALVALIGLLLTGRRLS